MDEVKHHELYCVSPELHRAIDRVLSNAKYFTEYNQDRIHMPDEAWYRYHELVRSIAALQNIRSRT